MQINKYNKQILKKLAIFPFIGLIITCVFSCKKEPAIVHLEPSVAWKFYMDPDFTTFVSFLQADTLLVDLNDIGKTYTVFAPTNLAFTTFFSDTASHEGFTTINELRTNELNFYKGIENIHVINGLKYTSTNIPTSDSILTRLGAKIKIAQNAQGLSIGSGVNTSGRVIEERTVPSGNLFIIDKVQVPSNVDLRSLRQSIRAKASTTKFIAALARLEALSKRTTTAGASQAQQKTDSIAAKLIMDNFTGRATRTVFIPTDAAFEQFFISFPALGNIETMPAAKLINLVNNHTLNGTVKRAINSFTGIAEDVVYKPNTAQGKITVTSSPFKFGTADAVASEYTTYRGRYYFINNVQTINATGY